MKREEQPQKRRRGRWGYLDDFQQNVAGEYIYTGAHYHYGDAAGRTRRRLLTGLWLLAGLAMAAILIQGFLPVEGMRGCAYVVIPYAGALLSACSLLWALGRLSANKEPLREYIYKATAAQLTLRSSLTAGFAGASFLGEGLYLLLHGLPSPAPSLAFLGLSLLALTSILLAFRWRRGVTWTRTEPES